ncbi:MAG: glycosyltransferase [Candidatus Omnitrophica bacterium]|nr:glycosyltransferase [Candidatus Omnitrophota bacterium]
MAENNRLLYLMTGIHFGGVEQEVVQMAMEFKRRGWDVVVASLVSRQGDADKIIAEKIPITYLGATNQFSAFRVFLNFLRLLRDYRPHILHSHQFHANIVARIARIFTKIPVVISTIHNSGENSIARRTLYKMTDRLCDLTTFVSHASAEQYARLGLVNKKRMIIPNSVDTGIFYSDETARRQIRASFKLADEYAWLTVGRLESIKDYPSMLKAFSIIVESEDHVVLLICGIGTLEKKLQMMVKEMGLNEKVYFLGARFDMPQLMNAADGFVLSSSLEGMPKVLLEAMSTGLPIVATNVGGVGEIVRNGLNGFLVEPGNPVLLAEKMKMLMDMPKRNRHDMGQRGSQSVSDQFSVEKIMPLWESVYRRYRDNGKS